MDTIGQRIREARKAAGLDQNAVAVRVGVTSKAVSMWERNETIPQPGNMQALADILNRSVKWIYGGDDPDVWEAIAELQERVAKLEGSDG